MQRPTLADILMRSVVPTTSAGPRAVLPTENTQGIPTFERDEFLQDRAMEAWKGAEQGLRPSPWMPVQPDMNQRQRAYSPETAQKYDLPFLWGPWDVQMVPRKSF